MDIWSHNIFIYSYIVFIVINNRNRHNSRTFNNVIAKVLNILLFISDINFEISLPFANNNFANDTLVTYIQKICFKFILHIFLLP